MFQRSQRCVLAVAPAVLLVGTPAFAGNLVFNGGFETGTFLGWSVPPNQANQTLFLIGGGGGHSGEHFASMASSTLRFMSQTLPTSAGTEYELSFWLRSSSGLLTRSIVVRWEGEVVLDQQFGSIQPLPWTRFAVPLHANITGSFLEFGQFVFPGTYDIDDISVVPVPAPSAALLLLLGSAVALRRRRR